MSVCVCACPCLCAPQVMLVDNGIDSAVNIVYKLLVMFEFFALPPKFHIAEMICVCLPLNLLCKHWLEL